MLKNDVGLEMHKLSGSINELILVCLLLLVATRVDDQVQVVHGMAE